MDELKNTTYELFIGALSVLSIVNLALYYLVPDPNTAGVIKIMDGAMSLIFLADFLYRLFSARSKSEYFIHHMGWADLLASVPFPQLKILRIFRILRAGRLMKALGAKRVIKEFVSNRGGSALLSLLFMMMLILEFGGLAMLSVEIKSPDANIKNASDVLWYIYVTVTTVGYGDRFPVTNSGRIIGVVILTIGVGLFGTLTAFLANAFIKPTAEEADEGGEPSVAPDELKAQMDGIQRMLLSFEKTNRELKTKIEDLEQLIQAEKR
jgi:voltage-gated potassium channel